MEVPDTEVVDLLALAAGQPGLPAWSARSEDLNVNLAVMEAGDSVDVHVNGEVDVLLVAVAGRGYVEIEGRRHELRAGSALLIPKGTRRAIGPLAERFAYLACHRRRGGLEPGPIDRARAGQLAQRRP